MSDQNQISAAPLKDFSEDKLNLQPFADKLTNLVLSQLPHPTNEHSKVIALDSGWGTGKTSFINMWTNSLPESKFIYLKYNAWENDDSPDALVPILCSFQQLIPQEQRDGLVKRLKKAYRCVSGDCPAEQRDGLVKRLKKAYRCLSGDCSAEKRLKMAISVSLAVQLGFLTVNITGENADESSDTILKDFAARQNHRKSLEELINDIRGSHACLLICIDELDRCRPTFAIETLEAVKHFFDIPNVVFVFSLDMKQLRESIKVSYGNIDSAGYLQRFFDHTILLPRPSPLENFLKGKLQYDFEIRLLCKLRDKFSISLRGLNAICVVYHQFKMHVDSYYDIKGRIDIHLGIFLVFIALKYSNPDKYWSFLRNGTSEKEFSDVFNVLWDEPEGVLYSLKDHLDSVYSKEIANTTLKDLRDQYIETRHKETWMIPPINWFCGDHGLSSEDHGLSSDIESIPLWQYIDEIIENDWIKVKDPEKSCEKNDE